MQGKRKGVLSERVTGKYAEEVVRNYIKPSLTQSTTLIPLYQSINKAHVVMLAKQKVIPQNDAAKILKALADIDSLGETIVSGDIVDDVYVAIETTLVKMIGEDVGGKMHTGRSRNEMTVCVLRMEARRDLLNIIQKLNQLRSCILELARKHISTVMPSFTHFQTAEPMTFGFYLNAFLEVLGRDLQRLKEAFHKVNFCPMGSGAIVGVEYALDRDLIADLLGFEGASRNALDSISNYDPLIETLFAEAQLMLNLSRVAEDLVLWSNNAFGMIELADGYVGTSSIMPQKRNPIMAELLRSVSSRTTGELLSLMMLVRDLPSGFNMDVKQVSNLIVDCGGTCKSWVEIATGVFSNLKVKEDAMAKMAASDYSTATDLANLIARTLKVSFRTAHRIIGRSVKYAIAGNSPIDARLLESTCEEITGKKVKLDEDTIKRTMDPHQSVIGVNSAGGTSPAEVKKELKLLLSESKKEKEWIAHTTRKVDNSESKLKRAVQSLVLQHSKPLKRA